MASVLVIACGAIARELVELKRLNNWQHVEFQCLPAELHNRPEKIPAAVRDKINSLSESYDRVFVAYADCGTGGLLDSVLEEFDGIERLPGAHCYEFFAGAGQFAALAEQEPGTFYLTDFLVRHFDRLVKEGLGLVDHPELKPQYFGNYRKLVYLAQSRSPALEELARDCADYLGLEYEYHHTGLGKLDGILNDRLEQQIKWQS